MNNRKVAFIICVNNEVYFDECRWYINRLVVPYEYKIEIIAIREANSITEAYNSAMTKTDANYKVYLHQDVFIYNKNFIIDILNIFSSNKNIGMLGLIGGVRLPESGIIYNSWNCGRTITCNWITANDTVFYQEKPLIKVEALDGMLLVTQYDIKWREDILKEWDFYDVSQSFEFINAGYNIAIPYQDTAWAIHDCGYSNLKNYDKNRHIMNKYYPSFFNRSLSKFPFLFNHELFNLTNLIYKEVKKLLDAENYEEADAILNSYEDNGMNRNILILQHTSKIAKIERESLIYPIIYEKANSANELIERYTKIKFYLRRIENDKNISLEDIKEWINSNIISPIEIIMITVNNVLNKSYIINLFSYFYLSENEIKNKTIFEGIKNLLLNINQSNARANEDYICNKRKEAYDWIKNKRSN